MIHHCTQVPPVPDAGGAQGEDCDNDDGKTFFFATNGWQRGAFAVFNPDTTAAVFTLYDLSTLEGSHFQTENDYVVLVYLRDFAQRCDKLVGVKFLNSRRDG